MQLSGYSTHMDFILDIPDNADTRERVRDIHDAISKHEFATLIYVRRNRLKQVVSSMFQSMEKDVMVPLVTEPDKNYVWVIALPPDALIFHQMIEFLDMDIVTGDFYLNITYKAVPKERS